MRALLSSTLAILLVSAAAPAQTIQYRALNGAAFRSEHNSGDIARVERELALDPRNVETLLALGLAQSAARQYREAVATFTRGLEIAPANPLLYRWRGHRYISLGDFDRALADLTRGNTLDTLNYDIWYHLGVARYERREFGAAADAFARAQQLAPNADEVAGSSDWLWMSSARAGRAAQATEALALITSDFKVTSATAYLQRLKLYRGLIGPDDVLMPTDTAGVQRSTLSYGVGNWYLVQGDTTSARRWFERAVAAGGWPAFAYFAAERELLRLK
ncbi:MAG: tetratricopeptide repeat protein [Gemmatimonadaceae bacterium]